MGREIDSLLSRSNNVRVMHLLRQLLALPPEERHICQRLKGSLKTSEKDAKGA